MVEPLSDFRSADLDTERLAFLAADVADHPLTFFEVPIRKYVFDQRLDMAFQPGLDGVLVEIGLDVELHRSTPSIKMLIDSRLVMM